MSFWERVLSLETARFILALLALNFCALAVFWLMWGGVDIEPSRESAITFALGQLFGLAMLSFNRYFGRGGDEQATGKPNDPLNVEPAPKHGPGVGEGEVP